MKMPSPEDLNELIPTRDSLVSRLKNWDDHESWREFFHTYWKLIYNYARRRELTDEEAQEVVQETIISVCRNLPNFKYDRQRGSFKGWLLQMTAWRITDMRRHQRREAANLGRRGRLANSTAVLQNVPDPTPPAIDALWEEEWQKNLIDAAIQRVKAKVKPKQFQIFDLCVLKRVAVSKVKETLGVNAAQVYLAKHRITNLIKREIKRVEKQL